MAEHGPIRRIASNHMQRVHVKHGEGLPLCSRCASLNLVCALHPMQGKLYAATDSSCSHKNKDWHAIGYVFRWMPWISHSYSNCSIM